MACRSALFLAALLLAAPVSGKKQEKGSGGAAGLGKQTHDKRPLYSPWTDEDSVRFWNADSYTHSDAPFGPRQTDQHPEKHPQQQHHSQHPQHPQSVSFLDSEIEASDTDESVIVMRELLKNLGDNDYMELARQISKRHSLGDARQAETVSLLRQDFELIKHIKRAPVLEAAVENSDRDQAPAGAPRWPGETAKRLVQMLGTILDKATREKPAKSVTAPRLRKSR